jgi:hypothetical protein
MTVFLSNGFEKFSKNLILCGLICLRPNTWMELTSPKPKGLPSSGKVYTRLNTSSSGGHFYGWGGRNCRFWQDSWLYEVALKIHYEDLFKWLEILNALFLIAGLNRIGLLISEDLYPTLSFRYGLYYMMNFNTFH